MLNIVKRSGGIAWQALSGMFADQREEEVIDKVTGLIESRQAHASGGIVYHGPAQKRQGKPEVYCYRFSTDVSLRGTKTQRMGSS